MPIRRQSAFPFRPSLPFCLLVLLLAVLWVAGGASRADASGQVLVRSASAVVLVIAILLGVRPVFSRMRPVLFLLLAAATLALLQLLPLPPAIWELLPGRHVFVEPMRANGIGEPWRPLAIVPGAAVNAAASLILPTTALVLTAGLPDTERKRLPGLVLVLVSLSMLLGLLQFSGAAINNPFINDTPGQVSGSFANRNHLALFLALGCLLAPVWAFLDGHEPRWRGPTAFGLVLLFVLTILASGSRTGLLLGVLALGIGFMVVRRGVGRALGRYPRWVFPALISALVGVIAIFVLISFTADRALSITRVLAADPGQDMRALSLPTVLAMIGDYFPFGSGLGGFDRIFRIHETLPLLSLTYFNHAHNDWLEIVLDAGLPGLLLLLAAVLWWTWASVRAWRAGPRHALPKLGSAMLLLMMIASIFDYPARTPMIMAMIIIAGMWLSGNPDERVSPSLPKADQHL